jgi:transposase
MLDVAIDSWLSEGDRATYERVVPQNHFLRKALAAIPWEDFRPLLAPLYSANRGRPSTDPVLMLKLVYLSYHFNLSDREVIARATTDVAFRYFLQFPLLWSLPDPSSLCNFRGRLGKDGFQKVFDQVVAAARKCGVVKDRLRIKDATHLIANIAVPSTLGLVAQIREKLLAAAEPFAPLLVAGERIKLEQLREATQALPAEERLASRVAQLQDILAWADPITAPDDAETNRAWRSFDAHRQLAHKILDDRTDKSKGDRTVSVVDPDARRGRHGDFYEGYLVDVLIDADSEIATGVNLLSPSDDEAADTAVLIRHEEQTHGNDVDAVSIDGAGWNGPALRDLECSPDLQVDTYVPPPKDRDGELYSPRDFHEDKENGTLTCPAGQTTATAHYEEGPRRTQYRFAAGVCAACPLLAMCMKETPRRHGRTVNKSDYQAEHERARRKATTPEYAAVRREHSKIERKLGELMNRHGGRRARSRGSGKVLMQQLMATTAMNIKRLVRLGCALNVQFA